MNPCQTCPFRRTCTPGALGGSPVKTYIGQTHGNFYIPCHSAIDYTDPHWHAKATDVPHCAGAAIFRANIGMSHLPPALMQEENHTEVFSNVEEFALHHCTPQEQETLPSTPDCVHYEMQRAGMYYCHV